METYEVVLEALGDRTRRRILHRLREGPAAVSELAAAVPVSRPAVSQHLRVLHRSGLVRYEEVGTRNVYRLDPTGLEPLRGWLDGFWQTALDSFAEYVHEDAATPKPAPAPAPAAKEAAATKDTPAREDHLR